MFTITPIGSCRINTPLRIAAQEYKLKRNLDRVYGFCHSSAEAVQQVRFLFGDYTPSQDVEPLISPSQSIKELLQTKHQTSDLYIVELSSAKQIMLGEESVQMNYLVQRYRDFFSDKPNAVEFWRYAQIGGQSEIDRFLTRFVEQGVITHDGFSVLRKLRYQLTSRTALRQDVDYLLQNLPEVLFISHVNAVKTDGQPIASREKYINMVKTCVADAGGVLCDPTEVMELTGQEFAIEDNSTSLAHFTPGFSKLLFDDWLSQAISPLIDSLAKTKKSQHMMDALIADLKYQIRDGVIDQAKPRIDTALELFGPTPDLVALNAHCLMMSKDHEKAVQALKQSLAKNPADTALLIPLLEGATIKGDTKEAFGYFERLRALDCVPPVSHVLDLADKLETEGRLGNALVLYRHVYAQDPDVPSTLEAIARISLATNDQTEIANCAELLTQTQTRLAPELSAEVLLQGVSPHRFKAYLKLLAEEVPADYFSVLDYLESGGNDNLIAEIIAEHASTQEEILDHPFVRGILATWKTDLQNDISVKQKFEILNRIQLISTTNREARIASKELRNDTLSRVRSLIKSNDVPAVEDLQKEIALAVPPILDAPIFLSRHYYKADNNEKALEYAQLAMEMAPDNIGSVLMAMRSAFKLKAYLVVDQTAKKIIKLGNSDLLPAVQEAQKRLDRLPALCLQASRNEPDFIVAWKLAEIATRNEALAPKARHQLNKIKKKLGAHVRKMQKENDPDYLEFTLRIEALIPDFEIVLQSLGRYYVSQRQFDKALPYWEQLSVLQPDDEASLFQLERCYHRAPKLQSA